jgi:acyl-CoA synthetase (NDP forming)
MEKFFYPHSVAVVGVSPAPDNLGQGIVSNLLGFKYRGKIFLVGRRPGTTFGLPIFPGLKDLPQAVDLAVILAPARLVPSLVRECGELGITRVVVESAGFSELSDAGRALEEEVRSLLQQYGLRLVGPNGLGLMNLENGLALPFATLPRGVKQGPISIIAQSGGVATHLLAWMTREGLGLNKFLSLGNKLDVAENEVLAYLLSDPGTAAVYLYLEGLSDGRALLDTARGATKPVFLHLANVGEETAGIARSHTASLTADETVLAAACRQSGLIHVLNQSEFLTAAKLVGQPPVKGNRLVVLSRSGGEAVVAAYACRRYGFRLPPLSPRLVDFVRRRSRAGVISPNNPVDLGDIFDFDVYCELVAAACRDPEVDAVLLHYGPMAEFEREPGRQMAARVVAEARAARKPLAVTVLITLEDEAYFRDSLGMPVFRFPEEAVQALALSRDLAARCAPATHPEEIPEPLPGTAPITDLLAASSPAGFLPLSQALTLVQALGLPVAAWQPATSPAEAAAAAQALGYPVVLKLSAPSLVHKTEAGAVLLNLGDAAQVTAGWERLADLARDRLPPGEAWEIVVMAQAAGGREALLGARRDPSFGPVVAFGAGGIETEVQEDVSLRIAPVSPAMAHELIGETRLGRILAGIRGQAPADLESLARALAALSRLLLQFPQVQEVDLNPVLLFPGRPGLLTLDARIRVGDWQVGGRAGGFSPLPPK